MQISLFVFNSFLNFIVIRRITIKIENPQNVLFVNAIYNRFWNPPNLKIIWGFSRMELTSLCRGNCGLILSGDIHHEKCIVGNISIIMMVTSTFSWEISIGRNSILWDEKYVSSSEATNEMGYLMLKQGR